MVQTRETKEERKARELREAYEDVYTGRDENQVKTRIVELLNEIDDTGEQRQAQMDTMKDMIDEKRDELLYCRHRREYLRSAQGQTDLEEAADVILQTAPLGAVA